MTTDLQVVPARRGRAVRLAKGQAIQIINSHGQQLVDTWCFNACDLSEFMSMEHLHASLQGIFPAKGDGLATNRRRPILMLEEDTSPGRHDTIIAACDVHRYAALGCRDYHDNCTDNLYAALGQLGLRAPDCPAPLNLWMNIPVGPDGKIVWGEPLSKPGDYVTLRAVIDCIVVMSTCHSILLLGVVRLDLTFVDLLVIKYNYEVKKDNRPAADTRQALV